MPKRGRLIEAIGELLQQFDDVTTGTCENDKLVWDYLSSGEQENITEAQSLIEEVAESLKCAKRL